MNTVKTRLFLLVLLAPCMMIAGDRFGQKELNAMLLALAGSNKKEKLIDVDTTLVLLLADLGIRGVEYTLDMFFPGSDSTTDMPELTGTGDTDDDLIDVSDINMLEIEPVTMSTDNALLTGVLVQGTQNESQGVSVQGSEDRRSDWSKRVAEGRKGKNDKKKERNNKIGQTYQQEKKEDERVKQARRQASIRRGRLLALSPTQRVVFEGYLRDRRVWDDVVFQGMLNPAARLGTITSENLDCLFRRICDLLTQFLDAHNISIAAERVPFVQQTRQDLLGTRHHFHGDGVNLPDNYITHRRDALIYTGLVDATYMQQGDSDRNAAQSRYEQRLQDQQAPLS